MYSTLTLLSTWYHNKMWKKSRCVNLFEGTVYVTKQRLFQSRPDKEELISLSLFVFLQVQCTLINTEVKVPVLARRLIFYPSP
jgi:hypothetical protein